MLFILLLPHKSSSAFIANMIGVIKVELIVLIEGLVRIDDKFSTLMTDDVPLWSMLDIVFVHGDPFEESLVAELAETLRF